ncbi:Putative nickel-responsive regulator [Limihaloglobus sulfuriphilus]|uniref:Putative nickel-responsive regulator n=1 Tax=Limihaloglobus sulfuriphilus TaxID=1851148 RepID=A0A1Q2MIR1_9BACT|nr:nickel-responsive transcriptional regulator NikR [Limihaloglobus sulfuriphilus]AQQ72187.1 Putative nickel-responsive regulator [Limihaloglobus sulfuriphilus]
MSRIERIGVSIEQELLSAFDELIAEEGCPNRSEAVRDMIRLRLSQRQLLEPQRECVAAVTLMYDHHEAKLTQKLIDIQHNHLLDVIATTHVHIDHDNCLEVIIMKGKAADIEKLGKKIASLKGVKLSRVNVMATNFL